MVISRIITHYYLVLVNGVLMQLLTILAVLNLCSKLFLSLSFLSCTFNFGLYLL